MTTEIKAITPTEGFDLMIADMREYLADHALLIGTFENGAGQFCTYGLFAQKGGWKPANTDLTYDPDYRDRSDCIRSRYDGAADHIDGLVRTNDRWYDSAQERGEAMLAFLQTQRDTLN